MMSVRKRNAMTVIFLAGCLTALGTTAFAQAGQNPQQQNQQNPNQQQPQQPNANRQQKPADTGSSLEVPKNQAPANPEEEAAVKEFQTIPNTDIPKKIS